MNTTPYMHTGGEIALQTRSLKIEAGGDPWKGGTRPKIRLMGRWLERAGFKQDTRVIVRCISPGVIELRSVANAETEILNR